MSIATLHPRFHDERGFTLIELSIVLVIIGLIIGGVLLGRDLIAAADIRATLSQIEKYNVAAKTFRLKYNGLPGDIAEPNASAFGFVARGTFAGQGDGNGVVQGYSNSPPEGAGPFEAAGETVVFWRDLSAANLIDGQFNTATNTSITTITLAEIPLYFPPAKLGQSNSIYVWSGGMCAGGTCAYGDMGTDGYNYWGISNVWGVRFRRTMDTYPGLSVQQAYDMDAKIDDALPQLGKVRAMHLGNCCGQSPTWVGAADTSATAASSSTCYDNGNAASATQKYSTAQNKGTSINCALSFRLQ